MNNDTKAEILHRLRVALEHHRQAESDQLDLAYRVRDWLRWLDPDSPLRVHIRDRSISVFDGRKFHALERPRDA